jgi:tetratricopeptide (TPR) repeat protein
VINVLKTESPNKADLFNLASYVLRRQGKWLESIKEAKSGIQLDPYNAQSITDLANTFELLHQYDNQAECARQGLSLIPDYKSFNKHIFNAYLHKSQDLKIALKESGLGEKDYQYEIYYFSRQYDKLIDFIKKDTVEYSSQFIYEPKTYRIAFILFLKGNKDLCKIYTDSAITELNKKILEFPNDERYYATIGKCYAFVGNSKEALNYGEKAIDLKPMKRDAWQGVVKEQDLMDIYIFTGEFDFAMDKMEYLLSIPSRLHKSDLSINPIYDCLIKLPRLQKILKTEYKMNL